MITCFGHYDILAETRTQSFLMKTGKWLPVCLPSFPWCNAKSLKPSHQSSRKQEKRLGTSLIILAKTRSRMTTWTTCKIRHHVFTIFDARIRNVKRKNKNVLEVLKSSIYISLFEPRQSIKFSCSSYSNTFLVMAFTIDWFSNRTRTSVDDGKARGKD